MSPFLSDCPSLMLGIAIQCIQHSQAMLERGVCELAHSFFHSQILQEKFDKLELDYDSKAQESESYKKDLEKVISELAQIKETVASGKEDKDQLAKDLDRLRGEIKVFDGT